MDSARKAVEFSVAPKSHLWVVICLCLAGAGFGLSITLFLGELVYATQDPILEALLTPPSSTPPNSMEP